MRNTFSVLFYANRTKEKEGHVPILCRITVSGTTAQFSCKLKVPYGLWSPKEGRVIGRTHFATSSNMVLDGIRSRLTTIYHELAVVGRVYSAKQIRDLYFGGKKDNSTLLSALDKLDNVIASRVGKDRAPSTLNKYKVVRKHVADFLAKRHGRRDIFLYELDEDFLRDFCIFLRDEAGVSQSSVWVYQMPIRAIATQAFNEGLIPRNPFTKFHVTPDVRERQFLSEDQMRVVMKHKYPPSSKLGITRDMFVFCCFTGLSFIDLKELLPEEITEINGTHWIISRRHKTKVDFQAKLLPPALKILQEHGSMVPGKPVFEIGKYCTVNNRLKRVGKDCGVSNNLTFHMARHTFATLALSKGMSMESLKSVLGHTDLQTTQIYAKITTSKLEKEYSRLAQGFEG